MKIHRYASLPSTNALALELAEQGAEHGEVVLAETQSAGRGRLGKSWTSPPGKGLYLSIILKPQLAPEEYARITLVTGVAVADVIADVCGLQPMLKWPNDVYLSGKKCCGILAESAIVDDEMVVVAGIGINVTTRRDDFPEEVRERATSLALECGYSVDRERVLVHLHEALLREIKNLEEGRFADILARWRLRDYLRGRKLCWVTWDGKIVEGTAEEPDDDGSLRIRDCNGNIHTVMSGDVTLAAPRHGI